MVDRSQSELERIQRDYERRDAIGASAVYKHTNPAFLFQVQERERLILDAVRLEGIELERAAVLDVGCGTGATLQRLADFGAARTVGVDLMEHRIAEGRNRFPTLELQQGNAAALPFADASFDVVFQFTMLSSILDAELRGAVANEMWRVTRPGGVIVSYDLRTPPAWLTTSARLLSRFGLRTTAEPAAAGTPLAGLGADELRSLFPSGSVNMRSLTLDLQVATVVRHSHLLASFLALVPFLRTHLLATIRRPG